jgi:hypothetical protein
MEVIVVLVFISLVLVVGALLLLFVRINAGDFEHGERLSLLPLEPDERLERGKDGEVPDGS